MKYTYFFGANKTEGHKELKDLLGGKGANLAEMASIGVPVPPGFTITTIACKEYYENNKSISDKILIEIEDQLKVLEDVMGAKLGNPTTPLLLSVRSGAAISMPGMMDTVLNLGLNEEVVVGLAKKTNNPRFAWDSYRRFIQMFGNVVLEIPHDSFEKILDKIKSTKGVTFDTDLNVSDLQILIKKYKALIIEKSSIPFPDDPKEQLILSIKAVFNSWNNLRAIAYRKMNHISGLDGTGITVQAMVYGNMGETSGTGVCFSRNPSTGENIFYGEYLMNAQGEDVVAGIRTPQPISHLHTVLPHCYDKLVAIYKKLEQHYTDMQDMEFTIQEGKLFMLQTRIGKRTAQAAVRIAVDMVKENLIDKKTALLRVDPNILDQLLHKQFNILEKEKFDLLAKGLPASPGAAVGKIVFTNDAAIKMKNQGDSVILVRNDTSPEDLIGMDAAVGILTAKGGMTSHAAVIARGMGKCCVSGCSDAKIHEEEQHLIVGNSTFTQGDYISLDGLKGEVFAGKIPTVDPELSGAFATLMKWADDVRSLQVRTNADTPKDALQAIKFGAEGIGLCRTEHMFFESERIRAVREMILANDVNGRESALEKIKPFQKKDFYELFKIMDGKPITIRLLDPPLHEFLPKEEHEIKDITNDFGVDVSVLHEKIDSLSEVNPMLGHRGCRLGITYPEITRMQAEAIFEAAVDAQKDLRKTIIVEVMVPLIGDVSEFIAQKNIIQEVAKTILNNNLSIILRIGTMIEVPRAALTADAIAKEAEFFSFGTNDLTQMTYGFSRDDVSKFLPEYIEKGLLKYDPFQVLDQIGVGQLVKMAVQKGKSSRPNIKLGICGEHGGEPASVEFCHKIGLNYVSCSPFRVPIARLAAAHAILHEIKK